MYIVSNNLLDRLADMRLEPPKPAEDPTLEKLEAILAILASLDRKATGVTPSPG